MPQDFRTQLIGYFDELKKTLATPKGDWVIKGFIDIYKNIYTISVDTKVISKIIELMVFPIISGFAVENNYKMVLSEYQNHYPDITFISESNEKFALDLKTTYRVDGDTVNGFTLGAFTGYFRNRNSTKNITFSYNQYSKHFVLGFIYTRQEEMIDERKVFTINELQNILSVVTDFDFLLQEKYLIANDQPGSGNTKNIGSVKKIADLKNGTGAFARYGLGIFDDYWMHYLTKDMARAIDLEIPPYRNLKEYLKYKNLKA